MAITVGGTSITFNDATVQSTAAVAASTALYGVGTYIFALNRSSSNIASGGTTSGSNLIGPQFSNYPTNSFTNNNPAGNLPGTWRNMAMGSPAVSSYYDPCAGGTVWVLSNSFYIRTA